MKSLFLILVFLLLTCLAFAEIPLVLEATIQLPASGAWDVQHWMSDSTYGWACIDGHTVFYAFNLGDSIRSLVLPDTMPVDFFGPIPNHPQRVRLLRLASQPAHAFLLIQSAGTYYNDWIDSYTYHGFTLIDATTGLQAGFCSMDAGGYDTFSCEDLSEYTIGDLFCWPAAPQAASYLLWTRNLSERGCRMGGISYQIERSESYFIDMEAPTTIRSLGRDSRLSPFSRSFPLLLAATGYDREFWSRQGYPSYDWDSSWVRTLIPGQSNVPAPYPIRSETVAAQQDSDGTQRLILSEGRALNTGDYSQLWQNNAMAGTPFAGQLDDDPDEYVLTCNGLTGRCAVFGATDGAFRDSTTQMSGVMTSLIKHPDRPVEIVTYDTGAHTARAYRAFSPVPRALTCEFSAESQTLHLTWRPVADAARYRIYSSSNPGSAETLEAVVPAPAYSLELIPADHHRFYSVTAEYPSR